MEVLAGSSRVASGILGPAINGLLMLVNSVSINSLKQLQIECSVNYGLHFAHAYTNPNRNLPTVVRCFA
ncbi:hypothetical protein D3C79_785040 [compost metagenome]